MNKINAGFIALILPDLVARIVEKMEREKASGLSLHEFDNGEPFFCCGLPMLFWFVVPKRLGPKGWTGGYSAWRCGKCEGARDKPIPAGMEERAEKLAAMCQCRECVK